MEKIEILDKLEELKVFSSYRPKEIDKAIRELVEIVEWLVIITESKLTSRLDKTLTLHGQIKQVKLLCSELEDAISEILDQMQNGHD